MPFTKIQMVTGLFLCTLLISACNNAATPPKNNTPDTSNKIIQINSDLYTLPLRDQNTEQYNYAVKTSAGIVWLPAPKMNIAWNRSKSILFSNRAIHFLFKFS